MALFSDDVITLAQQTEEKYHVPASVTLAQYAIESGYGKSNIAKTKNNYFGVKSSTGYASYGSMSESFDAHGKLLSSDTYTKNLTGVNNVAEYVQAIAPTYSESSTYSSQLLKIINDNNLTQYDKSKVLINPSIDASKTPVENGYTSDSGDSGVFKTIGSTLLMGVAILFLIILGAVFFMSAFNISIKGGAKIV